MKKTLTRSNTLAGLRTRFANERTMLAYLRTAITFMVSGLVIYKFWGDTVSKLIFWLCFLIGIVFFVTALYLYNARRKMI